jgi:hypothetical protein
MSWAARRRTTRIEDEAYCLMGLFEVNIPLLYGEGRLAFVRLQQEILKISLDHTIFAWGREDTLECTTGLLATSPSDFQDCQDVKERGSPNNVMSDVDPLDLVCETAGPFIKLHALGVELQAIFRGQDVLNNPASLRPSQPGSFIEGAVNIFDNEPILVGLSEKIFGENSCRYNGKDLYLVLLDNCIKTAARLTTDHTIGILLLKNSSSSFLRIHDISRFLVPLPWEQHAPELERRAFCTHSHWETWVVPRVPYAGFIRISTYSAPTYQLQHSIPHMVDTTNTRVENHWNLAIDSSDLFCRYDEISSFSYWSLVFSSGDRTLPPLLIAIKNYRAIYRANEELSSLWFGYVLGPQDLTDLNENHLRAIFNHSALHH